MNPFTPLPVDPAAPAAGLGPRLRGIDLAWFGIAAVGYPAIYAWAWRDGASPDPRVVTATVGIGALRVAGLAAVVRRWRISGPLVALAIACGVTVAVEPNLGQSATSVVAFLITTMLVGLAWRAEEARGRRREAWIAGACLGVGVLVPGLVVAIHQLPGVIGVQVALFGWQWWVVRRGLGGFSSRR